MNHYFMIKDMENSLTKTAIVGSKNYELKADDRPNIIKAISEAGTR